MTAIRCLSVQLRLRSSSYVAPLVAGSRCGAPRLLSTSVPPKKQVAFAFDIDGVLKAGNSVLPAAKRAIQVLEGDNPLKKTVPYIFITNGGGKSESNRAKILSDDFGIKVSPHQVVQAHTVLQSLSRRFGDKPVLMIGGPNKPPNAARKVMNDYGFQDVYSANDIHAWQESSWPFRMASLGQSQKQKGTVRRADFTNVHFAAVLVFHDSRDWGRDIQYICDILRSPTASMGSLGDDSHPQPYLAFSHGDLLWGNEFSTPRFGQGAFQQACKAVYEAASGRALEATTFGKPERLTFEYADGLIKNQVTALGENMDDYHVWMVGDNPASDIAGANSFGWKSALVGTGVYRPESGPPAHGPSLVVSDVEEAVRKALSVEWEVQV